MPDRDYYNVLEVARDATPDQIKKAYRAMARKYHPDVNPGDKEAEKKFKEAQEAYDILSDADKRKLYDQFGKAAFEGVGAGPRAGGSEWVYQQAGPGPEFVDFSQFFGHGGPNMGGGPGPGAEPTGGALRRSPRPPPRWCRPRRRRATWTAPGSRGRGPVDHPIPHGRPRWPDDHRGPPRGRPSRDA